MGHCRRLRSSATSGESRSSGASSQSPWSSCQGCRFSQVGFRCWRDRRASVEHPASLSFSHFSRILGWTIVRCLRWGLLCKVLGRPWGPLFSHFALHPKLLIPCGRQSKEVTSPCAPHVPHAWIFSPARKFLSPCQPSESSGMKVLAAGLWPCARGCPHTTHPRDGVLIASGAGDDNPVPRPHVITSSLDHSRAGRLGLRPSGS